MDNDLEPDWPGPGWQVHCGDPDCQICDPEIDIPPERLALWFRWRQWERRLRRTTAHDEARKTARGAR
jgi:hypothetical protein